MTQATYAQRIARNYYENMVPLPRRLDIAPAHAEGTDKTKLAKGPKSLHALMAETYRLAGQSPDAFHLPSSPDVKPRAGKDYGWASRSFARLPRLLFAMGLIGQPMGKGAKARLTIPLGDLEPHCKRAHVTRLAQLLSDEEFQPLFLIALARENPANHLDALARAMVEKIEPKNFWGGAYRRSPRGRSSSNTFRPNRPTGFVPTSWTAISTRWREWATIPPRSRETSTPSTFSAAWPSGRRSSVKRRTRRPHTISTTTSSRWMRTHRCTSGSRGASLEDRLRFWA